jgi:hypothetical protein
MTAESVKSELAKSPFTPFRLHLVSGKTVDVRIADAAMMLKGGVFVLHPRRRPDDDPGYDIIALSNIERLEQLDEL